jgi:hypothetical protein
MPGNDCGEHGELRVPDRLIPSACPLRQAHAEIIVSGRLSLGRKAIWHEEVGTLDTVAKPLA